VKVPPFRLETRPSRVVDAESVQRAADDHRRQFLPGYCERVVALLRLSRRAGAEPMLLTQPALYGPGTDDLSGVDLGTVAVDEAGQVSGAEAWAVLETYNDALRSLAATEGVRVIDLARQMPRSSRFFHGFVDFTNEGAERAAAIVAGELPPLLNRDGSVAVPAGS
jgi:hypothetical protein